MEKGKGIKGKLMNYWWLICDWLAEQQQETLRYGETILHYFLLVSGVYITTVCVVETFGPLVIE
jgi:hypothetical protein